MCRGISPPSPQEVGFHLHGEIRQYEQNANDESVILAVDFPAHAKNHTIKTQFRREVVVADATPAGLAIVAAMESELVESVPLTTRPARGPITKHHFSARQEKQRQSRTPAGDHAVHKLPSAGGRQCSVGLPAARYERSHVMAIRKNGDEKGARKSSIFCSAFSPPKDCVMEEIAGHRSFADFMGTCFLCQRPLGSGIDIYMYRGDRAFCSNECRYQHIVEDELSERSQQQNWPTCRNGVAARSSSSSNIIPVLG
ncbi:hypothetical protein GOP47_0016713 [Adiantum capillus-veneris]|uniref:FLZ-type domain-containing protein n=1 Tax=Adiantum capillus-veneris TaxID=13818 RepID=A0A9D4UI75_ADICA|nr:hypothetical protein GOP47_0016713 [Adiantum capillus-veneris]